MHTVMESMIQTHHDKDFVVRRPGNRKGNPWVILCFSNDCMIQTAVSYTHLTLPTTERV